MIGVINMAKCPKCGTEVPQPTKTWTLAPKGRKPVTVGLFKCPSCGAYFNFFIKSKILLIPSINSSSDNAYEILKCPL